MSGKENKLTIRNVSAEFLTFAYQTGGDGVEVRVQDGTVWLSQKLIASLFETSTENVIMHIKNIVAEAEIDETATAKDFLVVQNEGGRMVNRRIKHFNLDMIIAQIAKAHAENEFEKYRVIQDKLFESDYDEFLRLGEVPYET